MSGAADEYPLDTETVREFIVAVREGVTRADSPEEACDAIRPSFAELLADESCLPEEYTAPAPASGMGGGIGQWLLFRAGDASLSLFSLVVPAGAETPVHDHLAWASSVSIAARRTRRSTRRARAGSCWPSGARSRPVTSTF